LGNRSKALQCSPSLPNFHGIVHPAKHHYSKSDITAYLEPTFREARASGIRIWNESAQIFEDIKIDFATMEADEQAKNYASEHLGVNTRENCHRCHNSGVQDKKGHGSYQKNYLNGIALTCDKKTNAEMRRASLLVANGEINPQENGIGKPSAIALNLPNFDIVKGWLIEYFHKLMHVDQFIIIFSFLSDHVDFMASNLEFSRDIFWSVISAI